MPAPAVISAQRRSEKIVAFKKLVVEFRMGIVDEYVCRDGLYVFISHLYDKIHFYALYWVWNLCFYPFTLKKLECLKQAVLPMP